MGFHGAEATAAGEAAWARIHSTSLTIRRKRLPMSTTVAVQPFPTLEVNTSLAVSALRTPIPRKWTSRRGFRAAIQRADLQHVGLKYGAVLSVGNSECSPQGRAASGQSLVHHPERAVESGGFPVAFGAEAVSFGHPDAATRDRVSGRNGCRRSVRGRRNS